VRSSHVFHLTEGKNLIKLVVAMIFDWLKCSQLHTLCNEERTLKSVVAKS